MKQLTAVYKKSGKWYVGWVEEIPGVNTQGKTLRETKENLQDALRMVLEHARMLTQKSSARGKIIREAIRV